MAFCRKSITNDTSSRVLFSYISLKLGLWSAARACASSFRLFLPHRNSLLRIVVSVSTLITFLSNECVGQEAVKWSWAACLCVLTCVRSYLWVVSSRCICFQHLCTRLFTLCTVCLSLSASLSSPSSRFFWQLRCREDAFLIRLVLQQIKPLIFVSSSSQSLWITGGRYGSISRKTLNCLHGTVLQETMYTHTHTHIR